MPTIDYTQLSLSTQQSEIALISVLEDIANNVEIKDDLSICHPLYQPLKIPQEAVERFQQMPAQIKQKFLSLQLRSFLYGLYYNGSMRSSLALDADPQTLQLDLENNSVNGIDTAFFQRLHEANSGKGFFDRDWQVLKAENDDIVVVRKGGLRLYVQRNRYLTQAEQQAQAGDTVSIKVPKNRVQNGFYMSVGDKGFSHPQPGDALVRIYFNLTPDGAVTVMDSLTKGLNEIGIPFSFKVLYNPKDYIRYDSGVLYFARQDYPTIMQVIRSFYDRCQSHLKPEIPLFTKQIAIGLGLAEDPNLKFADRESFGMNRCQIVANGLLSLERNNNSQVDRMNAMLEQFLRLGISLRQPYLSKDSSDTYHLLASSTN